VLILISIFELMKNDSAEKIIANINKNVKNKQWVCLIEGCEKPAINSHMLQRNGILNNVAENFHVCEVKAIDVYAWKDKNLPKDILQIKAIGILHSHAYPTLCSSHDTAIFKPIEIHPVNFKNYKNSLLFAYRTLISLYRKEQIVLEKDSRMVNSQVLQSNLEAKMELEKISKRLKIQNHLLELRKKDMESIASDLESVSESFVNYCFDYPPLKVYASGSLLCPEMLEHVFINIFPYNERTFVLLTTRKTESNWKSEFINSWKDLEEQQFKKRLTGFLTRQCENWGISPLIAENLNPDLRSKLYSARTEFLTNPSSILDPNLISPFSIF
jgi:hypothetical protein